MIKKLFFLSFLMVIYHPTYAMNKARHIVHEEQSAKMSQAKVQKKVLASGTRALTFAVNDDHQKRDHDRPRNHQFSSLVKIINRSWISQYVAKRVSDAEKERLKTEDASAYFQTLGKDAQDRVGIPAYDQLPIKRADLGDDFLAVTFVNCIVVNEQLDCAYGCARIVLLHEALHSKYLDTVNIVSILKAFGRFSDPYESYKERRADIEACYASKCHKCVEEFSSGRPPRDTEWLKGYISREEALEIAERLEEQHLVCDHHQA